MEGYPLYDSLHDLCATATLVVTATVGDTAERYYDYSSGKEVERISTDPMSNTAYGILVVTPLKVTGVREGVTVGQRLEVGESKSPNFPSNLKSGRDYVLFLESLDQKGRPLSLVSPTQAAYELTADGSLHANRTDNILPKEPVRADGSLCASS